VTFAALYLLQHLKAASLPVPPMSLQDIGYLFPSRLPQSLFVKAASLPPMALQDIGYLFPHSHLPQRLFVMTPIHPQPAYPPKVPTLVPQFEHT
jgi:hypothetical protein